MLSTLLTQFNKSTIFYLLINFLILYNLYQLIQQRQLTFFLGYMLLIILYAGCLLIYLNLDIMAFILWIVYGSFIVVIFIFSFMWLNFSPTQQPNSIFNNINIFILTIFCFLCIITRTSYYTINWQIFTTISWINFYELLPLNNSEELEALGWGLSYENMWGTFITTLLLTFASITAIAIVIIGKKNKWVIKNILLTRLKTTNRLFFTAIRTQHMYQQEKNNLIRATKTIKSFHHRRT